MPQQHPRKSPFGLPERSSLAFGSASALFSSARWSHGFAIWDIIAPPPCTSADGYCCNLRYVGLCEALCALCPCHALHWCRLGKQLEADLLKQLAEKRKIKMSRATATSAKGLTEKQKQKHQLELQTMQHLQENEDVGLSQAVQSVAMERASQTAPAATGRDSQPVGPDASQPPPPGPGGPKKRTVMTMLDKISDRVSSMHNKGHKCAPEQCPGDDPAAPAPASHNAGLCPPVASGASQAGLGGASRPQGLRAPNGSLSFVSEDTPEEELQVRRYVAAAQSRCEDCAAPLFAHRMKCPVPTRTPSPSLPPSLPPPHLVPCPRQASAPLLGGTLPRAGSASGMRGASVALPERGNRAHRGLYAQGPAQKSDRNRTREATITHKRAAMRTTQVAPCPASSPKPHDGWHHANMVGE